MVKLKVDQDKMIINVTKNVVERHDAHKIEFFRLYRYRPFNNTRYLPFCEQRRMEQPLPIKEVYMRKRKFCDNGKVTIIRRSSKLRKELGLKHRYQLWAEYNDLVVCIMFKNRSKTVKVIKCHDDSNEQNHVEIVLGDSLTINLLAEELAHKLPIYASRIRDSIAAGVPSMTLEPRPGKRAY